ncbi:MAG: hypothetical protein FJ164_13450 [Gammaproteobacteria bacterium]|nr:hypothetical protein [Gammaproteobacteria bacterium]
MKKASKPPTPISRLPDPDMQGAAAALMRAAMRAREIAYRTNTPLIVFEDGKLIEQWISAEDLVETP